MFNRQFQVPSLTKKQLFDQFVPEIFVAGERHPHQKLTIFIDLSGWQDVRTARSIKSKQRGLSNKCQNSVEYQLVGLIQS